MLGNITGSKINDISYDGKFLIFNIEKNGKSQMFSVETKKIIGDEKTKEYIKHEKYLLMNSKIKENLRLLKEEQEEQDKIRIPLIEELKEYLSNNEIKILNPKVKIEEGIKFQCNINDLNLESVESLLDLKKKGYVFKSIKYTDMDYFDNGDTDFKILFDNESNTKTIHEIIGYIYKPEVIPKKPSYI